MTTFNYDFTKIEDLAVETEVDIEGKTQIKSVLVKDEPLEPTPRFWVSLFARFGFNKSFFTYFDHNEVFERIAQVKGDDRVRVCIEREGTAKPKLLAVSNPKKPVAEYNRLMGLLEKYDSEGITYADGCINSTHRTNVSGSFEVNGDLFDNRFVVDAPIDGYGSPKVYLACLRDVCQNQLVAVSKDFKTELALGKNDDDVTTSLTRALDSFNSDEGYAALRQRLESAGKSWASIFEAQSLYNQLTKLVSKKQLSTMVVAERSVSIAKYLEMKNKQVMGADVGNPLLKAFDQMTGDPCESYGLANLNALAAKRQRSLPVKCTVYDLINFASEVSTHHSCPEATRSLSTWVGQLLVDEFDMEGTKEKYDEFADFMIDSKVRAGVTG